MTEVHLHGDVETRSTVDLLKAGAYRYFEDPSTDVLCLAWAVADEPVQLWKQGEPPPQRFNDLIKSGAHFYAHNAAFERLAFKHVLGPRYGFAVPTLEQSYCTLAMGAAMALPKSLDKLARALQLPVTKDETGRLVMLQLCKPRRPRKDEDPNAVLWWEEADYPEKHETLYAYCINDVVVEREIARTIRPLSEFERRVWLQNQIINDRGVPIDVEAVQDAIWVLHHHTQRLEARLAELTGGAVKTAGQTARMLEWLNAHGVKIVPGENGEEDEVIIHFEMKKLDKRTVSQALKIIEHPTVREVLRVRQELSKASTKKLNAFYAQANRDRRARGHIQYHAASTGRDGGRGIQMQNLPRPALNDRFEPHFSDDDIDFAFRNLRHHDPVLFEQTCGSPTLLIADMLRGMIKAPKGRRFLGGDYSNIEGRVLAWLAGESSKVNAFVEFDEGRGPDIYKRTAGLILNIEPSEVTKSQRQVFGKVPELALGFGGGVGAFQTMAKNSNVAVSDVQAEEIKVAWRERHPNIVQYWYDLERAALQVLRRGGKCEVGRVAYAYGKGILWCKLPSGRLLSYFDPQIREIETPWGQKKEAVTYMTVVSESSKQKILEGNKRWGRIPAYGGLFAENVTQAAARDVLKYAELRLEAAGYEMILPVHDEENAEVRDDFGSAEEFKRIMEQREPWMDGLPVVAEVDVLTRYRK